MATPDLERDALGSEAELERLRMLVEASGTLLGSLSVAEVLPHVLDLAQRTLEADAHSVWGLDPNDGVWKMRTQAGLSETYVAAANRAVGGNTAGVSLDEPIVAEDIASTEWLTAEHRAAHLAEGTRSMLAVAMRDGERLVGTLAFYYRREHRFPEGERSAAATLANLAAAAIVRAELYEAQARDSGERALLAEASALLASSLEIETTLQNVASLIVPVLADWCTVDLVQEDGSIGRLAVAHVDPEKVRLADELADRYPPDPDAPYGVPNVIRAREPELLSEIPDELLVEATHDQPELLEILRGLGLKSSICVPLVVRDRALGAITFIAAESGRHYDEHDLATAARIAERAAIAVDNALLHRQTVNAFRAAEAARERLALLAEASTQLAGTLDYETTLANIASLIVPRFADWYAVDVVQEDGSFRRLAVVHRDPDKTEWAEKSRLVHAARPDEPEGTGRVVRTGQPLLYARVTDDLLAASTSGEEHLEVLRELGMESSMVVPLTAGGRTFGALMLVSSDPDRLYDESDLDFAGHLARRAAVAVDNARLYREARSRGDAALVVEHVGDGVVLVDRVGVVGLWNPAAERITGIPPSAAVGRPADELFGDWQELTRLTERSDVRPETRPVEVNGRELWLSVVGVSFVGGSVYAFRDLTEERAVERLKSDFVATVSHELRTPLPSTVLL